MWLSVLAIGSGAALGALLRWALYLRLSNLWAITNLGTLSANLLGGYLIGLALAFFGNNPAISSEWRLFLTTGFLGGLTTFSTFSVEVVSSLQKGTYSAAIATVLLHLLGSLLMTMAGILTLSNGK